MPRQHAKEKAHRDQRQGKAASTQAGEFVREEIDLIRHGAHGVRSTKQAIAIGLSKARRAGVKLPPPKPGSVSGQTRKKARRDAATGARKGPKKAVSRKRSRATLDALRRESTAPVSKTALAQQTRAAARKRSPAARSAAAKKAARTRAARQ
jgi:uncharacterized protein DUF6496